jgi:molybdopterin synthase sulfur carrier subunit
MKVNVLAFGIAKDIFGSSSVEVELSDEATVGALQTVLEAEYPRLKQLASYMVAVNDEYAAAGDTIEQRDEIAIIPPVSGG